MAASRHVAVVDIGKSNAKLALVDLATCTETGIRKIPNRPRAGGPYPHHDVETLWAFILESLASFAAETTVDAISVTTHGATCALLDAKGDLALPILDYEHDGPDTLREAYDAARPSFAETGSPTLPGGLNIGAQLFWQAEAFPEDFAKVRSILMYPQYWTHRLTGVAANEATSLGAHTDLWNPHQRDVSSLVDRMGWRHLFAPIRPASERLGPVLPEIARRTGLDPATPVFCGIHDSNASLLPHLITRRPPFTVVSTGTWVVSMTIGGGKVALNPDRDTLINVNAFGDPVPSARFMGGREHELLAEGLATDRTEADIDAVLSRRIMLMPSVVTGSGPFPRARARWLGGEASPVERSVAATFYLALMTATCLGLIGAAGEVIVEGPLASDRLYLAMLATATARPVLPRSGHATGTSIGAALLAGTPERIAESEEPVAEDAGWREYAEAWRAMAEGAL